MSDRRGQQPSGGPDPLRRPAAGGEDLVHRVLQLTCAAQQRVADDGMRVGLAPQQVGQDRGRVERPVQRGDQRPQPGERVPGNGDVRPAHRVREPFDERLEQVGLAAEVVVHQPLRHPGALGDPRGGRRVEPVPGEQPLGRVEDAVPGGCVRVELVVHGAILPRTRRGPRPLRVAAPHLVVQLSDGRFCRIDRPCRPCRPGQCAASVRCSAFAAGSAEAATTTARTPATQDVHDAPASAL